MTTRDEAVARFRAEGEPYKVELAEGLPEGDEITEYTQDGFVDLCRGPHLQDTKPIRRVQADLARRRLLARRLAEHAATRIYGTAFFSRRSSRSYLHRLEEARARDHRRLGAQLDLFHFSEDSPGSPFWHPKGMAIWNALRPSGASRTRCAATARCGRRSCSTSELWKRSGHWDNYRENMFFSEVDEQRVRPEADELPGPRRDLQHTRHSYRDLPLRLAEQGLVHRNERRGVMHGLLRVRHITQDDAHIFCTWDQVEDEVIGCLDLADVHLRDARPARPGGALDAARQADRQRGAVGSQGGRARGGARDAPAGTIGSTRATGRSTRRRSTST